MTILILWDIDGTLVTTASAGRRAIDRAFAELFGWEDATRDLRMDGRTDPWIVDEVFRHHGLPVERHAEERRRLLDTYVGHLEREMKTPPPPGRPFGPLPGIVAALERFAKRDDCIQGLLTGNIEPGARAKLAHFDLWRFFSFGAFGDDADERPGLFPVALTRAGARHGDRIFSADRAIVIGDTPRDVEVGRVHGARTVAVATGLAYGRKDLEACGADHVFDDLSDTQALVDAIVQHERRGRNPSCARP